MNLKKIDLFPKTILLISTLIIIFIIITFGLQYSNQKKLKKLELDKKVAEEEIRSLEAEKYSYTSTPTPTLTISAYTIYDLNVELKTEDKFNIEDFIFFTNDNIRVFDKSEYAFIDSFRIYSSPNTTKKNHKYLLMVIKDFNIKNFYENEKYKVTLTPNKSISIEYLYDNYYCQTTNDCVIKDYTCSYGPFNKYERIRTSYGCEGNSYDHQEKYSFGPYDTTLSCNSKVTYNKVACIKNKCVGLNRTIKCIGKLEDHP